MGISTTHFPKQVSFMKLADTSKHFFPAPKTGDQQHGRINTFSRESFWLFRKSHRHFLFRNVFLWRHLRHLKNIGNLCLEKVEIMNDYIMQSYTKIYSTTDNSSFFRIISPLCTGIYTYNFFLAKIAVIFLPGMYSIVITCWGRTFRFGRNSFRHLLFWDSCLWHLGYFKEISIFMIRQSKDKQTVSNIATWRWLPLAGGTSGFLGGITGTFFSGTTSLGASGT